METRQIIDWEHAIKEKIESCKGKYGFPNAGDFGVTDEEVADYVYDKQRILDREDDRRKHLVVPGIILVMPVIILSGFGEGTAILLIGVLLGVVLMLSYFALMRILDKNKLRKMIDPDIEKYLAEVEDFKE